MQAVQTNSAVFSNADLFFMPPYLTQPTPNPVFISWINKFDHNHNILLLVNEWSCLVFFVASNFLIFSSFCMTTHPFPTHSNTNYYNYDNISDLVPSLVSFH